ncbi:hypothetical protein CDAR_22531 [Caerostris darwini]|uniref:Uncharacterized protein n=1 Tax=Caerostris darwini TaxID=1538125 RepID=A0AAV4V8M7_9ARAC|nr:hypothetical protein CDAR_22531 [Caerostris darwini]
MDMSMNYDDRTKLKHHCSLRFNPSTFRRNVYNIHCTCKRVTAHTADGLKNCIQAFGDASNVYLIQSRTQKPWVKNKTVFIHYTTMKISDFKD